MSLARFRVYGKLGKAGGRASAGFMVVDRANNLVTVNRLRSREKYVGYLDQLAEIMVERQIKAEVARKRAERKAKRG